MAAFLPVNPRTVRELERRIDTACTKRDTCLSPVVAETYQQEIDWLLMQRESIEREQYPKGRLNEADEGGLEIAYATDKRNGRLMMEFGKPVTWLGLTADDCEGMANMLTKAARELRKG